MTKKYLYTNCSIEVFIRFYLLLIILLLNGCDDNKKEQEKIVELQNIISAVEKQDFSIFDKYFSKDALYPVFCLQDTIFTNINHIYILLTSIMESPWFILINMV